MQASQIEQFPTHCGQIGDLAAQADGGPVGIKGMEAAQEAAAGSRVGTPPDLADQSLPRGEQGVERFGRDGHADELVIILRGYVEAMRTEQFVRRARMADEIDQEGAEQIVVDPLSGEEMVNVEQAARMLTIERGRRLARGEVGQRDDLHLGEAEAVFDARADGPHRWREDCAPQHGRDFHLDGGAVRMDKQAIAVGK